MKEKVTMKQILFMTMFIFTTVLFGSGDMSVVRAADSLSSPAQTVENTIEKYEVYESGYVVYASDKTGHYSGHKFSATSTYPIVVISPAYSSASLSLDYDDILTTLKVLNSKYNSEYVSPIAIIIKDFSSVTLNGYFPSDKNRNYNLNYIRITGVSGITDNSYLNITKYGLSNFFKEYEAKYYINFGANDSYVYPVVYYNLTIGYGTWTSIDNILKISDPVSSDYYDIYLNGYVNVNIQYNCLSSYYNSDTTGYWEMRQLLAPSTGYSTRLSPSAYMKTASLTAGTYTNTQTANTYTATYNANGGSVSTASKTVTYDSTYGTLATPTRTGYTFAGWWTAASGGTQITASTTVKTASNHTLYAHWNVNTYTVTLDLNGGTSDTTSVKVTYDSAYTGLPTPTKTGYTFEKWYLDSTPITIDTKVSTTADHTLVANYKANTYTVMFSANGGTCNISSIDYIYDSQYKYFPTPTKDGYSFAGWYTEEEGGERVNETDIVKITSDVKYYAHWSEKTCTVTFDAQGGTCGTSYITVAPNTAYGILPTAKKSGYTFVGWATDKSGTNFIHETSVNTQESDFTVYAIYKSDGSDNSKTDENGENAADNIADNSATENGEASALSQSATEQTKAVQSTKATIKKVTNKKGKKLQIKINKVDGYKYQIQVSTSKKFKKTKKYSTSKTSYTVKKLKKGKKYYVRVRLYKKINGKNVYGKWSKVKSVKIKK